MQLSWWKRHGEQWTLRKGRSHRVADHLHPAGAFMWWREATNPAESTWNAWGWWEKVAWEAVDRSVKCKPRRAIGFDRRKYRNSKLAFLRARTYFVSSHYSFIYLLVCCFSGIRISHEGWGKTTIDTVSWSWAVCFSKICFSHLEASRLVKAAGCNVSEEVLHCSILTATFWEMGAFSGGVSLRTWGCMGGRGLSICCSLETLSFRALRDF